MSIKIGNIDVSYFKVGGADCSIYIGSEKLYPTTHDYSEDYLTFRALEDGTFSFGGNGAVSANTLEYSVDSGSTWSTLQNSGTTPTVASGNTILWKASGLTIGSSGIGKFSSTGQFEAEGNIMSLHFGDDFSGQTSLSGMNYAFNMLFYKCTGITSAENLVLPATTLASKCYQYMFFNCTSLTTAPNLPAMTLASYCYDNMFSNCTSLTTAPELPATTLEENCYRSIFKKCTSLASAPSVLPATTLATQCYQQMFNGCSGLTESPILPAETLKTQSYGSMFNGCTSLSAITCLATDITKGGCTQGWVSGVAASGTFTKAASMSSWTEGDNGIPSGWTVVDYSG